MNVQVQFINVWVLYLLWLVPLVAWWWYASARLLEKRMSNFLSADMQNKLRPPASRVRQAWQTGLITAGLLLVLVAAARPQWGTREEIVYQRGKDVVIALDVSRSMLANDVHPNRLLRAKADILDLIKELHGDRAALLAFRKKAVTLCPLTTDYAYLNQALESVAIDSAPAGETDISDAIYKAMEILKNDEGSHKAIVLISDGEDLSGKALAAAEAAGKKNIPIFTVGLGSIGGSRIPDPEENRSYFKYKGQEVVSKLNNTTMQAIAEATSGAYIPVGTASMTSTTLGILYRNHLSKLSAKDFEETLQRRHVDRFQWFLVPAFLLLLAGAFLSRGRLASSTRQPGPPELTKSLNKAAAIIILLPALTLAGSAQTTNFADAQTEQAQAPASRNTKPADMKIPEGREGARIAQKLYLLGKYEEASKAYLEAVGTVQGQSQRDFRYNASVALFKAGKYRESAEILKDLELLQKEKPGENTIAMGLGSALYRASELPKQPDPAKLTESAKLLRESGEAFKEASRAKPGDNQARKNLAVVLETLPAAEEQARTAELMAKYEKTPAQQIADQMLQDQRKIVSEIPPAFTNDSPAQIKTLETIAGKQKANADLWIPLKDKLLNSMAQQQGKDPKIQQQIAAFDKLVEGTRTQMKNASAALRDLDTTGYNSAVTAEAAVYQFWKSIAGYQSILQEDIRRQTNTISVSLSSSIAVESRLKIAKAEQDEALNLTEVFKKRFSDTVPESGEPQQTTPQTTDKDKNAGEQKPEEKKQGISAETRRKILELADQAVTTQKSAQELIEKKDLSSSVMEERKAHDLLKEIEKLLPKDKSQDKQDQKQDKKDDQKQQQDQQKNDQQQKQQDQQQNQQQQEDQQKQKPEDQKEDKQEKKNKDELTADQLKKLLEKAAQRENEHEIQKRERNRTIPLTPIDRDW